MDIFIFFIATLVFFINLFLGIRNILLSYKKLDNAIKIIMLHSIVATFTFWIMVTLLV